MKRDISYIQKIIDSMPDFLIVCDRQGKIKLSNKPFDELVNEKANEKNILNYFSNDKIFETNNCEGKINNTPLISNKKRFDKDDWIVIFKDMGSFIEKEKVKRQLQDEMMRNAYSEGISENAISILHNIGNILTPITLKSKPSYWTNDLDIGKTIKESIKTNPEKAKELQELYLEHMDSLMEKMIDHFQFIYDKSMHISEVIQSQQKYAKKDQTKLNVSISELINDVVLTQEDIIFKNDIKVHKFINDFSLNIEKIGLHQALSNFIVNAIDSLNELNNNNKTIEISAFTLNDKKVIEIKDNGKGISKENLQKIYEFGFSTKQRSSGFGLHSCSNFIKKNNGSLKIESQGLNKGATITISF